MDKPRVLVLYYSQSGQLRDIIDRVLSDVRGELDVRYAPIQPVKAFPFPWKASSFFDAMPECVLQKPSPVVPLPQAVVDRDYDLIILGWQPWFLHPSQPITAFLQSESAAVMEGKPVVTVVGCRNMWLNAGEKIKEDLIRVGAQQIGNIVLTDTSPNLVSLLTIIRWAFSGKKEASKWLPAAGVQEEDIVASASFGKPILEAAKALAEGRYTQSGSEAHLASSYADRRASDEFKAEMDVAEDEQTSADPDVAGLHRRLVSLGAIKLNTALVLLEQRGVKNFRFWAMYIREKGGPGSIARKGRVTLFKRLLLTAIFVLSPISSLTAFIQRKLQQKRLLKDVEYFKGLKYEPGRI
jgi:hypothetical protein